MKVNNAYNHEGPMRSTDELNAAQWYLFGSPIPVLGRSLKVRPVIERIPMPPLPLLQSNRAEREALKKKGMMCFFKQLYKNITQEFKCAYKEESNKPFYKFNILDTLEIDEDETLKSNEEIEKL